MRFNYLILLSLFVLQSDLLASPNNLIFSANSRQIESFLLNSNERQYKSHNQSIKLDKPFLLRTRIPGLGAVNLRIINQRRFRVVGDGKTNLILLQGEATIRSRRGKIKVPLAASLHFSRKGKARIRFSLISLPSLSKVSKNSLRHLSYLLELNNSINQFEVLKTSKIRILQSPAGVCGTHAEGGETIPYNFEKPESKNVLKQMSVIIEGDQELSNRVANLYNVLAYNMNWVDTVYKRDLQLTFDATIVSEPQNYSKAVEFDNDFLFPLHQEMRDKRNPLTRAQDIHYLVTGKPAQGSAQGLAGVVPDLGTVCISKQNSIGVTVFYDDWLDGNASTTAHEIGHLLNAEHDDNSTGNIGFIMNSGTNFVDQYIEEFSEVSQFQVFNYVVQNGFCMKDVNGTPEGGESNVLKLKLSRNIIVNPRNGRQRITLSLSAFARRKPVRSVEVQIACDNEKSGSFSNVFKTGATNRRGLLNLRLKPKNLPRFCRANTADNQVFSKTIRLRR